MQVGRVIDSRQLPYLGGFSRAQQTKEEEPRGGVSKLETRVCFSPVGHLWHTLLLQHSKHKNNRTVSPFQPSEFHTKCLSVAHSNMKQTEKEILGKCSSA